PLMPPPPRPTPFPYTPLFRSLSGFDVVGVRPDHVAVDVVEDGPEGRYGVRIIEAGSQEFVGDAPQTVSGSDFDGGRGRRWGRVGDGRCSGIGGRHGLVRGLRRSGTRPAHGRTARDIRLGPRRRSTPLARPRIGLARLRIGGRWLRRIADRVTIRGRRSRAFGGHRRYWVQGGGDRGVARSPLRGRGVGGDCGGQ